VFRDAARGEEHAVTDGRHQLFLIEKAGDMALQNFAFEVFTHAARTMSARQQQRIESAHVDGIPPLRRDVIRIDGHFGVGFARVAICPHQKSDEGQISQQRNGSPWIEALPRQHHRRQRRGVRRRWQN
jgi:hypothetical protein